MPEATNSFYILLPMFTTDIVSSIWKCGFVAGSSKGEEIVAI